MSDRLEEIKEARNNQKYDEILMEDFDWLIQEIDSLQEEVERLREHVKQVTHMKDAIAKDFDNQSCEIESLQSQLATVKKERDELRVVANNHEKNRWDNFDLAQKRRLENENLTQKLADAEKRVEELESKLCPGCHGKGFYLSDPALSQTRYQFQCKVCDGKGSFK